MTVTLEEREQIKRQGYAIVGGIPKNKYWTPDGREIVAVPAMRTYNKIKDGKIVGSGIRDAHLDNGWLLEKPEKLKPYCPHCDKWHDTQEEIDACGQKKGKFQAKQDRIVAETRESKDKSEDLRSEVDSLKSDVSDIKNMLEILLKQGR